MLPPWLGLLRFQLSWISIFPSFGRPARIAFFSGVLDSGVAEVVWREIVNEVPMPAMAYVSSNEQRSGDVAFEALKKAANSVGVNTARKKREIARDNLRQVSLFALEGVCSRVRNFLPGVILDQLP